MRYRLLLPLLLLLAACGESEPLSPQRLVTPPTILSFSPTYGPVGTEVRINGKGFGTRGGDVVIEFGDVRARIARIEDDMILTSVPGGAATGPIAVVRLGARVESHASFTVPRAIAGTESRIPSSDALPPTPDATITIEVAKVEAMIETLSTIGDGGSSQTVLRHDTLPEQISYAYTFTNGKWAKGIGGIDTLRGSGYKTLSNTEWESWSITIVVGDARRELLSTDYRYIRSGHSDGTLTSSKSQSTWGSSASFTLVDAPFTIGIEGAVESRVSASGLDRHRASFLKGSYSQSRSSFTGPTSIQKRTIVSLPPSGSDAYIHVRYK